MGLLFTRGNPAGKITSPHLDGCDAVTLADSCPPRARRTVDTAAEPVNIQGGWEPVPLSPEGFISERDKTYRAILFLEFSSSLLLSSFPSAFPFFPLRVFMFLLLSLQFPSLFLFPYQETLST